MIDNHVHIDFWNIDSELKKYEIKAKEINLKEFTITNHIMLPIPNSLYFIKNFQVFLKDSKRLKCSLVSTYAAQYCAAIKSKGNPNIKVGAELDYSKELDKPLKKFIDETPFDLVLGSLHMIEEHNVSRKEEMKKLLEKKPAIEIYKKYFTELRSIAQSRLFDIISHVDLVRKHSENVKFTEYMEEANNLIDDLLKYDTGIEVNSSGHVFIGDSYPTLEFLALCKQKGLEKITIGSDAHQAENLGEHLEKAVQKLKRVGYKKIVKFKNRKPEYIDL